MVDVQSLKTIPLFSNLDDKSLGFLAGHIEARDYQPGDVVFKEKDSGGALFVVDSGQLSISKVIDWDDMTEKELATVGKGAYFGEMSLLDDEPRSATVRCKSASRLLVIPSSSFLELLGQSSLSAGKLLTAVIRTVNGRLRRTNRQFVTLYDTGRILGEVRDLQTLAAQITERVVEALEAERGLFVLHNPYSQRLEILASRGYDEAAVGAIRLQGDSGLLGRVMAGRTALRCTEEPATLAEPAGFETRQMLLCPIVHGECSIGALVVANTREAAAFTDDDVVLLNGVSMQVATAVEHARMLEEQEAHERHRRVYIRY